MHYLDKRLLLLGTVLLTVGLAGFMFEKTEIMQPRADQAVPVSNSVSDQRYFLIINKINVNAPVILNVSGSDEQVYLKAIEHGVAHYEGTALPGTTGNSVIFGHSAYYQQKPGNYKEVFKDLNQLAVGDQFMVRHLRDQWLYTVERSQVISNDTLSVLEPTDAETITLLTCWPPKTTDKRYVVQAKRVLPSKI